MEVTKDGVAIYCDVKLLNMQLEVLFYFFLFVVLGHKNTGVYPMSSFKHILK